MKVKVEVVSQKGICNAGHKEGDCWVIDGKTVDGICFSAFCSLISWIQMERFDGKTGWKETLVPCPDPENPVVFRVSRIRE